MKKIVILLALIMLSVSTYGQADYNKWAVEAELGVSSISDKSALSLEQIDNPIAHLGVLGRYNFNPKFGLGVVLGYNNMDITDFYQTQIINFKYTRVDVEGFINIFKILDLYPKNFTMLLHGGPGVGFINTDNNYDETVFNVSGGITGLFRIKKRFAIKLDLTTTSNVEQSMYLDGTGPRGNTGVNSLVHDMSVGFVVYLGKKDKNDEVKVHADWVKPVTPEPIHPTIVNNYPITYITKVIQERYDCEYVGNEYVFFDHDKYDIRGSELNAIYKTYERLRTDDSYDVIISGWASNTSSTFNYNLILSRKRCDELKYKLVNMGIPSSRIRIDAEGKDFNLNEEVVHDLGRRVELILVKDNK